MGGQEELQRRDVPAAGVHGQGPAAEARPSPPPQRAPRLRAGDPVGQEAAPTLEPADGAHRARARDPVDITAVEAAGAERDLQRGDVGGRGSGRRGERDGEHSREEQRASHATNYARTAPRRSVVGVILQVRRTRPDPGLTRPSAG